MPTQRWGHASVKSARWRIGAGWALLNCGYSQVSDSLRWIVENRYLVVSHSWHRVGERFARENSVRALAVLRLALRFGDLGWSRRTLGRARGAVCVTGS